MKIRRATCLLALLVSSFPTLSPGQWSSDPTVNTPVDVSPFGQGTTVAVPDGADGAIIVYDANGDIAAQRIDASGTLVWPAPTVVCGADGFQLEVQVESDGAGGALVAWRDLRDPTTSKVYAQRIAADGSTLWAPDGIDVTDQPGISAQFPAVVGDGNGGAIVGWVNGEQDVFVQRVDGGGAPLWNPGGVLLCDAPNGRGDLVGVGDGAGGAILVWVDQRAVFTPTSYGRRVDAAGTPLWDADGVALISPIFEHQDPQVVEDGSGGVVAAFVDFRNAATLDRDIYAQRLDGAGNRLWGDPGSVVCSEPGLQSNPAVAGNDAGGLLVTWWDRRDPVDFAVYTQHLDDAGARQWDPSGLLVGSAATDGDDPRIAADGSGGAIVGYDLYDPQAASSDVVAQRFDAAGTPLWGPAPVPASNAPANQRDASIVARADGSAIFAWTDNRDGGDDVYAQLLPPPPPPIFRRGDVNSDGGLGLPDAIVLLNYLFAGGPVPSCLDGGDTDDSGTLNLADATQLLGYLFNQGPPPPAPGPLSCGEDPTADALAPCVDPSC